MYITYSPIVNDNVLLNKFKTEMLLFYVISITGCTKSCHFVSQKFHQNISVSVYVDVY